MNWLIEVDAVFFDAVGTVIHPDPPAALAYAQVGRRFGSVLSAEVVRQRFAAAFAHEEAADLAAGLRTSEEREARRWRNIVAAVLDDVADQDGCFAALYEHFARPDAWRIDPEAEAVLAELTRRGLRVGLASNFDRRLRTVAAGLSGLTGVRDYAVSSELGWRKPDRRFFTAAAEMCGVRADRILLVGDDADNDYRGATAAGWRAVLFDPAGRAAAGVRRVGRLGELLGDSPH